MKPKFYEGDPKPYCNDDHCDEFDGKRCGKQGCRPGSLCAPAILEKIKKETKSILIVCANDSMEAIVIGDTIKADGVMKRLREEHSALFIKERRFSNIQEYDNAIFWHIHDDVQILDE
ncbi:MAG: hypothetical protein GY841_15825 [FCB group bacterium]|nr:hypothetical protein [FCB group bacterium]